MSEEPRLVVFEDGDRTGSITASGDVEYGGGDEYVEMILERFEGGAVEVTRTAETDEDSPFRAGTEARTTSGDQLFEQVRSRLAPLDHITLERYGEQETE